jgi:hypothetical protein
MKKKSLITLFAIVIVGTTMFSQTEAERLVISNSYDQEKLSLLEYELRQAFETNQQRAFALAVQNGWETEIELPNGGKALLIGVFPNGSPKYYQTDNREGGITTRADRVHTGGSAGLDLNGENMLAGIWDGGLVRTTHTLFSGRVTQIDGASTISNHATHVSGTMIGSGAPVSGAAKGMAPQAELISYSFANDTSEMTAAAADGLLVSNHSYGFSADNNLLWFMGYYDSSARDVDRITYDAPFYLPVKSAGNARSSGENPGDGGYDYLTGSGSSKNNVVVAATLEVLDYQGPSDVNMSSFSSWGPTDDGRIKPDISAKGVNMLSSTSGSNNQYGALNGTSMSAPSVSGSLILLQQHYNEVNGAFMLASTLRGLALHTADEAGTTPGPDYRFGWGLMNTERAVQVISDNSGSSIIVEETIADLGAYTFSFTADGVSDVWATIAWTDPAGDLLPAGIEDVSTPRLKNDLDLRISVDGGATFLPWVLDVANPTAGATTGDNLVDNIEKIEMVAPPAGEYIVRVSHKGSLLVNGTQTFSMIITGMANDAVAISSTDANIQTCAAASSEQFEIDYVYDTGASETFNLTFDNIPTGATATLTPDTVSGSGTAILEVSGLENVALGDYTIKVISTGTGQITNTFLTLQVVGQTTLTIPELDSPPNNSSNRPIDLTLVWDPSDAATTEYDFELALDDNFTNIVNQQTVPETMASVTGLAFLTEYFWRVKAISDCGESEFSDVRKFTTEQELGVTDNTIADLVMYPNPASTQLNLEASVVLDSVQIFNILGQEVKNINAASTKSIIDIQDLDTGVYFVKVTSSNETTILQLVKK